MPDVDAIEFLTAACRKLVSRRRPLGGRGKEPAVYVLVECAGLGATLLAAAPALWPLVGADERRARKIYDDTVEIALGEHSHYRVPALGNRGAPTGIDLHRVLKTRLRPTIDIVMVHREPGRGMIGFGLTSPPMACFEQAAAAFAS